MEDFKEQIEQALKPYRDLGNKLAVSLQSFYDQYPVLQKVSSPLNDVLEKLNEPLLKIQQTFENINKIYTSIPVIENPFFEQLEDFKEIGERLKEHAKNTPDHVLLLAENGWFIDIDNSELFLPEFLANKILDGHLDSADEYLANYYNDNISTIIETLMGRHSNRKNILLQILNSYKAENYNVLIPTVLAQVDGICFDFTKKKFFIKEKNNKYLPQVTGELEKVASHFLGLYLSPLQHQIPISAREQDINQFPCHLNRHEILHGINTDYGTEINSLKVISLLKYVSDVLVFIGKKRFVDK